MWGDNISSGPSWGKFSVILDLLHVALFKVCPQDFQWCLVFKVHHTTYVLSQSSKAEFCSEDVGEVCLGDSSIKAIFVQVSLKSWTLYHNSRPVAVNPFLDRNCPICLPFLSYTEHTWQYLKTFCYVLRAVSCFTRNNNSRVLHKWF